jgi:hypothetical protein
MMDSTRYFFVFPKDYPLRVSKMLFVLNRASPHNKSKKDKAYFKENRYRPISIYLLTTASTDFMVMREIRNIAKRDLLILKYYASFVDFQNKIS